MEQLIKITESEGKKVVSARELHNFLVVEANGGQIGEMFAHWIKRNLEYLEAKQGIDYGIIEFDYSGNIIAKSSKSNNQEVTVHKRDYFNCFSLFFEKIQLTSDVVYYIARQSENLFYCIHYFFIVENS